MATPTSVHLLTRGHLNASNYQALDSFRMR